MIESGTGGILVRDLGMVLGGTTVLRGITLRLGNDESISLIGPNGAGKSTLLRCMAGLLRPTGGGAFMGGGDIPMEKEKPRVRARMCGVVPQEMLFTVPFPVAALLELSRYPERGSFDPITPLDRGIIRNVVEMTGIAPLLDRTVTTLSGGEKRLVLIAAALAQDPYFLLLDEPTAGLDPSHRLMVIRILKRYRREYRRSVLMVTHDANDALLLGGKVVGLKKGTVALGPLEAADLTPEHLAALFDTPFRRWSDDGGRTLFAPEATP